MNTKYNNKKAATVGYKTAGGKFLPMAGTYLLLMMADEAN